MTQAMILAAGEGRRMRPLTLHTPKPLLPVNGKPLIEYQLARLVDAGITDCIINVAWLGDQIRQALGDGSRHGLRIRYSVEPRPLETGGAINRAMPILEDAPFLLINADIWLDYPLRHLLDRAGGIEDGHLVLVENPSHNAAGDFTLDESNRVGLAGAMDSASYTFSGLSLLHPRIVRDYCLQEKCLQGERLQGKRRQEEYQQREIFPLLDALKFSIERRGLTGEVYRGTWMDIGTPQRLRDLETLVAGK
jgi:MurNAc alpha-1-phosphate uridylyltransferase